MYCFWTPCSSSDIATHVATATMMQKIVRSFMAQVVCFSSFFFIQFLLRMRCGTEDLYVGVVEPEPRCEMELIHLKFMVTVGTTKADRHTHIPPTKKSKKLCWSWKDS